MNDLKELRAKWQFYVEATRGQGLLQENELVLQLIDERIKDDSILEEALSEIALFPQTDGDNPSDVADSMRLMAITALDDTRDIRYGVKKD